MLRGDLPERVMQVWMKQLDDQIKDAEASRQATDARAEGLRREVKEHQRIASTMSSNVGKARALSDANSCDAQMLSRQEESRGFEAKRAALQEVYDALKGKAYPAFSDDEEHEGEELLASSSGFAELQRCFEAKKLERSAKLAAEKEKMLAELATRKSKLIAEFDAKERDLSVEHEAKKRWLHENQEVLEAALSGIANPASRKRRLDEVSH
jgi:hypothetical protein